MENLVLLLRLSHSFTTATKCDMFKSALMNVENGQELLNVVGSMISFFGYKRQTSLVGSLDWLLVGCTCYFGCFLSYSRSN